MPKVTEGAWGFRYTSSVLERALDALGQRQRVTAHNVANVNTPGYIPQRVDFEESLQEALESDKNIPRRSDTQAPRFAISLTPAPGAVARPDGSGVDIDQEMANLSKSVIHYNATTSLVNKLYSRLGIAIKEGRR